jgi:hypothetical protein
MRSKPLTLLICAAALVSVETGAVPVPSVRLTRAPDAGIQPQAAIDRHGALHLIYFRGDPGGGDVFYVRRDPNAERFTTPLRVNSLPGSVIATGTVRGAHLALGRSGRVHVAWMGSKGAEPRGPSGASPMLYARLTDGGEQFEPQRNLMQFAAGLDGGSSVAADAGGNVYVAWHAGMGRGEAARRMWVARSKDDGATFAREEAVDDGLTGACGCCGMRAAADAAGTVTILYRSAVEEIHRDIYMLRSAGPGAPFRGVRLDGWEIRGCPMSTASIAAAPKTVVGWETEGQVYFAGVDPTSGKAGARVAAPGPAGGRRHPSVAADDRGETLLVWTEGTAWNRGGSLAWQLFDASGHPIGETGRAPGIAVWSLAAAVARRDGNFEIIY